jgi:hypothetical protein
MYQSSTYHWIFGSLDLWGSFMPRHQLMPSFHHSIALLDMHCFVMSVSLFTKISTQCLFDMTFQIIILPEHLLLGAPNERLEIQLSDEDTEQMKAEDIANSANTGIGMFGLNPRHLKMRVVYFPHGA